VDPLAEGAFAPEPSLSFDRLDRNRAAGTTPAWRTPDTRRWRR
jgi:hypothetical protein